ncbi:MAG: sugar phosphate isomerase/epimerase [Anaerolineae bacterium]|nr:sugar phosphate isomerase/epimerase [Anaerolineae bacterium]
MVNKVGIFYMYWVRDWADDFHPYIDKVADLGFDIIELQTGTIESIGPAGRKELKAHLDERGLDFTSVIGLPQEYDVSSEDKATRERGIAYMTDLCKAMGELGGGIVGGITYSYWPATLPPGVTDKRPYFDRSVESMKRMAQAAADHNVILAMEVVNRFEQYMMSTCQEALDYCAAVGHSAVNVMLDTFHLNIEEDFIGEAIERAGDQLGHFHVGENNRRPPGYGHIPWTEVFNALRTINYQGPIVMEPFVTPGGAVGEAIKIYRDQTAPIGVDEDARRALEFVRGLMK